MAGTEDEDLRDLRAEEGSRGSRRPQKALSIAQERFIRRIARLLADPNCEYDTYLQVIRDFGLTEQSDEYRQLISLWGKKHGGR